MALNSEYKEFFVRAVQMPVGVKKDQETGFLIDYQVTDVNGNQISAKNRFLKSHFPSEAVFKKLFNSVAFKLNPEDTATQDMQGLVRVVTGNNIINRTNIDIDAGLDNKEYTTVVVPSALPIVSAGTNITIVPRIRRASDDTIVVSIPLNDRGIYYVDYLISAANAPSAIDNIKNVSSVIDVSVTDAVALTEDATFLKVAEANIAASSVGVNDYVEVDLFWDKLSSDQSFIGKIHATFGMLTDKRGNQPCFKLDYFAHQAAWGGNVLSIKFRIRIYNIGTNNVYLTTEYQIFTTPILNAFTPFPSANSQKQGTTVPFVSGVIPDKYWKRDYSIGSIAIDWTQQQTFTVLYENVASIDQAELNERCTIFVKTVND